MKRRKMDNCYICGRPIDEGVQYIVSIRKIHFGSKPWFATDGKHYSFCENCDKSLKLYLNWWKNSQN